MNQIKINGLTFTYPGGNTALTNVNLSVRSGEFVTLCGLSGCGKSTLLRLMKPGLNPRGTLIGSIFFNGAELSPEPTAESAADIGFVMQDPESQTVTDKVWHELAFSCESVGMPQDEIRRRVGEMACYFGLEELFERETATLSGGQKQLLCLASAAALHPQLLLLDEPASQLDPVAAQNFVDAVRRLNRDFGVTVFAAEHRLEELLPISDRVILMDGGRIIADCPPEMLPENLPESHPMSCALTAAQRVFRLAGGHGTSPVSVRDGRDNAICRAWLTENPEVPAPGFSPDKNAAPLVEIRELHAGWGRTAPEVLRGVSLRLYPGEIYSVIGGNGSGKSTLLKAISGIVKPAGGRIKIRRGASIAYLPQNPCMLFTQESAGQEASAEQLERFGLTELSSRDPLDLSGGERQKLALAKLLAESPDILLLDEPTKGTDAAARLEFAGILRDIAAHGTAVLLVTHDAEFAAGCADMCGMLFNGEMINEATPQEMFRQNYFYTTPMSRLSRGFIKNQ